MTEFTISLSRPGSKVSYERNITTGSDGSITLTGFPAGLFTPGEIFQANIKNAEGEIVQVLIEDKVYSCLQLTIIKANKG